MIAFRLADKAFFMYGFAKNKQALSAGYGNENQLKGTSKN
ncbi:MAG: hypothetical protein OXN26_19825 [Gammaproteobacteria bacterium]|nr:hypothetical protein [Gammaproteobacteria bacterium]